MVTVLKIPKAAVSMQEGILTAWLVPQGAVVREGEAIYTLELEKSTMDVEAPSAGTLNQIGVAGTTYKVGEIIGEITGASEPLADVGASPEALA
jgi:pyruvate/2-oxoglutarate dehydrogenase complex dihydrolipoamide acyltransferase (E2) component